MPSIAWILLVSSLAAGDAAPAAKPRVTGVCAVAPDVLCITVEAGRGDCPGQTPYLRRASDEVVPRGGKHGSRLVKRGGREIGFLVGREGDVLWRFERLLGEPLDTTWADNPDSYRVLVRQGPARTVAHTPKAVHRKTKPTNMLQVGPWKWAFPQVHRIYLRLGKPMTPGWGYRLHFRRGTLSGLTYRHDPATARSEAVHVNHLGFRPDDPAKVAFLSCWMGSGGKLDYRPGLAFHVLEHETGRKVFAGRTKLSLAASQPEDPYKRNYSLVDVHLMDFSDLARAGTYRVSVEGIGCSYPFEIGNDVYRRAFRVAARGFYHQRSGIELGPPHTTYRRPRCFHPADGVKVVHSTCTLMESANGLNVLGTDKNNFGNLVAGRTDRIVPNAWGGYHDAGDWDRRIQHLRASRYLLELADLFPEHFAKVSLNIPESGDGVADVVSEALFNLDCYRRMQAPDGGIRGGIESAEHPRVGECSWQESLAVMAYAPGPWSSYVYAGVAARAATWLASRRPKLAAVYRASAIRAMAYAERQWPRWKPRCRRGAHTVRDARNLAAAELYRLTADATWHEVFLATTVFTDPKADLAKWQHHDQHEAAFVYLRTSRPGVRKDVQANARGAFLREADDLVRWIDRRGFRWTKGNPWRPVGWGTLGAAQAETILRAHHLSGRATYLRAAVLACQQPLGANPANLCYTTGLGHDSPANPLIVDQRRRGIAPPPGITVFGPVDVTKNRDHWAMKLLARATHPDPATWPTIEAYFDVWLFPQMTEFTVQQPMSSVAYAWGYLAART